MVADALLARGWNTVTVRRLMMTVRGRNRARAPHSHATSIPQLGPSCVALATIDDSRQVPATERSAAHSKQSHLLSVVAQSHVTPCVRLPVRQQRATRIGLLTGGRTLTTAGGCVCRWHPWGLRWPWWPSQSARRPSTPSRAWYWRCPRLPSPTPASTPTCRYRECVKRGRDE